jgi:predicted short-subunit dehydrogenase-like oxidoreductase (DUF2520 family)
VIGAGPVATALAGALRRGGVPVLGLWARNPQAARDAGAVAGVASYSAAPPDLLLEADVVILAVRDDAVAGVAETLLKTGLVTRRHVMLHCSGAVAAADAFAGVRDQLGGVGTLHPLRAIAGGRSGMSTMAGTMFGVEGDERGAQMALTLARAMGGKPLMLSSAQMAAYHAAAAMASNFVVALMDAASELLGRAGIAADDAISALVPLALGSLNNIAEHGLEGGLTGPIHRGDAATVARHLRTLSGANGSGGAGVSEVYRVLARRTVALARRTGHADDGALDAIARLLDADFEIDAGDSPELSRDEAVSGRRDEAPAS